MMKMFREYMCCRKYKNITFDEIEKIYKSFDGYTAIPLLKREVRRKNIRAYFMLAMLYDYSDRKKPLLKSEKLLKKGMEKGCPMCENRYQLWVGDYKEQSVDLENRLINLSDDILAKTELVFYYFRTLQYNLAFKVASEIDYSEYFEACKLVATLYECGSGVEKDKIKASEIRKIFFN